MLIVVLVLAAIQCAAACGCYALARQGGVVGFVLASLGGLLGYFVSVSQIMSPMLTAQFAVLLILGFGCVALRTRSKTFLYSSVAASLVAVFAAGAWSASRWSALRSEYPIESLADRLAYERHSSKFDDSQIADNPAFDDAAKIARPAPLSAERLNELDRSYYQVRDWSKAYEGEIRIRVLGLVHASYVQQFVESEGFGVGRMIFVQPSPDRIDSVHPAKPLPMPADDAPETSAEREQQRPTPSLVPLATSLHGEVQDLHNESVAEFASPTTFGYIESRQRVAGFLPHAFSKMPTVNSRSGWLVRKVELVSLLKHERPMVYVSTNLPNMSELGDVPVRALDAFEWRGLATLLRGEDLEIESAASRLRMLGSIRAAQQCLECHTVDHGALLGAFSYELRRSVPEEAPAAEPEPAAPQL